MVGDMGREGAFISSLWEWMDGWGGVFYTDILHPVFPCID